MGGRRLSLFGVFVGVLIVGVLDNSGSTGAHERERTRCSSS